jgi:two-component system sensor histidine kinase DesK
MQWLRARVASANPFERVAPFMWFIYLALLFVPLGWRPPGSLWFGATLTSILIYLFLYLRRGGFHKLRSGGIYKSASLFDPLAVAAIGLALTPLNEFANTYIIYSAAILPFAIAGLARPLLVALALLGLYAAETPLTHIPWFVVGLTAVLVPAVCVGNYLTLESVRKNAALKLSHDEIRRLAALAERERIGRDVHDLLGHTLSLIAIKSELAGKLLERDAVAAAREIGEVQKIARDALREVRVAVTAIRLADIDTELVASRTLLESSGIELTCVRARAMLPAEIEGTLAMIVREAVTNIQRHSGANRARIELRSEQEAVCLEIRDDGRGGVRARGNGLVGIEERVRNLGGTLQLESPPHRGTVLTVRLPLQREASEASKVSAAPAAVTSPVPASDGLPVRVPLTHT